MSSVVISGDTSGAITLAAPAVSGTNTATLPAATGTVMVSGNMPAFAAYLSANQSGISSATATKITFDTEVFDTNNNFASNRFTPTVAGYYQINAYCAFTASVSSTDLFCAIYKNGTSYRLGTYISRTAVGNDGDTTVSDILYMNGSTDYIEIYGYIVGTGTLAFIGGTAPSRTYVSGCLVRAA